jgi:hypothetical protein
LARLHDLATWAAAEELQSVRLNHKAGASGGFGGHCVDATVINLGDCTACDADHVMVVRRLAWNIGVPAIWKINPLDEVLVGEELKETEDGGASDSESAPFGVSQEVGGGEVPLPQFDQGGKLTARPGEADPSSI